MTIVSNKNTPRNTYTASANQTSFAISFEFYQITDVKVYKNGTLLTYNATPSGASQYSITGTASASDNAYEFGSGGSITLGSGASANDIIVIIRDISVERTTDFPNSGAFDITSLNTQLDTLTSIVADVKTQTDRSVKLLDTDTVSATVTLPAKATRQSKLMGFDANGNIETTVNSAGLATISGLTTEIQALGAISSDLTNLNSNISTVTNLNSNISAVTAVNSNISNINSVASVSSLITSDFVSDLNTLATTAIVEDLNILATTDIVSDLNQLATTDFVSDLNAVEGVKANVTTVANNLTNVNNFADRYRIGSTNPSTSLDGGDLFFNSSDNTLKFYNGSSWNSITAGIGSMADDTTPQLGGDLDVQTNSIVSTSNRNIAITPNGSGKVVLDGLSYPIADGTSGQALTTDGSGNLTFATTSSPEVYGFKKSFTASTLNRTVTVASVSGSNKYFIDGVQQDTLELLEGNTYIFAYPSGHPFKFSTTSNGSHGGGSEYSTGVTHNSSTQVTIVVATNAPTLYYYCSSHSGMGGQANTPVPSNNTLQVQTTNQGADNISESDYAGFNDVLFSASGFNWSINSGKLIATI